MEFIDDTYFEETIETPQGPVRVLAETYIFGSHVVLDELLFFPLAQSDPLKIGPARVLAIRKQIQAAARAAGFTELTMSYHRIGKRRTGNTIIHTRKLT